MLKGMKTRAEMGQELIALASRPMDGAAENLTLASRSIALLKQGASLEERDGNGMTALMWASRHYRRKIFNAIIEKNPDPLVTDNNGLTALDHARQKKQKPAIPVLEKATEAASRKVWGNALSHAFATKGKVKAKKPASFRKARGTAAPTA